MSGMFIPFMYKPTVMNLKFEYYLFQWKKLEWAKTLISYNTDKAARLPIVDVSVKDMGEKNQQFWVEIGRVCFI
jgi:hypothetical protein